MTQFLQSLFPKVKTYQGTGFLSRLYFINKVYTALVIFLSCFLILAGVSISLLVTTQKEAGAANEFYRQKTIAYNHMVNNSRLLLVRCIAGAQTGAPFATSDLIAKLDQGITLLRVNSGQSSWLHDLDQNYSNFRDAVVQYSATGLKEFDYLAIKNLYHTYFRELALIGNHLKVQEEVTLQKIIKNTLPYLGIAFTLLIISIASGSWFIIAAVKSVVEPARLITEAFTSPTSYQNIMLPVLAAEGLGETGVILVQAIAARQRHLGELKDTISGFKDFSNQLALTLRQGELNNIQLEQVYQMVVQNIHEQNQIIVNANNEISHWMEELVGLQRTPAKLEELAEQITKLLMAPESHFDEMLKNPIEWHESKEITGLADDLVATLRRVETIMETLRDIADQSELLSFNTAIEAARAGEEGQGFGVVSQEISKMVERSKAASNRLGTLLLDIQERTSQILKLLSDNQATSEQGFSIYQGIKDVGADISTTTRNSVANLLQLKKVLEEIVFRTKQMLEGEGTTLIATLPSGEEETLNKASIEIGGYLDEMGWASSTAEKLCRIIQQLQATIETDLPAD